MINLLSFTHSVSSHVILSVFSFSSIISNTFLCTDSLFLSIKELEHCIWNCLEHVVDDRQKIGTYFTETHWNTCLHLAALELYIEVKHGESWKETNSTYHTSRWLHVSPPMTTPHWLVLSQEHMEITADGASVHKYSTTIKSPVLKILLKGGGWMGQTQDKKTSIRFSSETNT